MAASDLASANAMFGEYADAIPAAAEVAVTMEGYLTGRKKTLMHHKDMTRSWAVLRGTTLSFFSEKGDLEPLAQLELTGTQAWDGKGSSAAIVDALGVGKKQQSGSRRRSFIGEGGYSAPLSLTTARHVYHESTPTDAEKARWVESIANAVERKVAAAAALASSAAAAEVAGLLAQCETADSFLMAKFLEDLAGSILATVGGGADAQAAMAMAGGGGGVRATMLLLKSATSSKRTAPPPAALDLVLVRCVYALRSVSGWGLAARAEVIDAGAPALLASLLGRCNDHFGDKLPAAESGSAALLVQLTACVAALAESRDSAAPLASAKLVEPLATALAAAVEAAGDGGAAGELAVAVRHHCCAALRHLTREPSAVAAIAAAGALAPLVRTLFSHDADDADHVAVGHALAAVRNVSADPSYAEEIGQSLGGLTPIVELAASPRQALHALAVGALGNLARCAANRRDAAGRGAFEPLLALCDHTTHPVAVQLHAVTALANLTRSADDKDLGIDAENCVLLAATADAKGGGGGAADGGLKRVLTLSRSSNPSVRSEAAVVLGHLVRVPSLRPQVLASGGLTAVVELLGKDIAPVSGATALQALAAEEGVREKAREMGALEALASLLAESPDVRAQQRAAMALAELCHDDANAELAGAHRLPGQARDVLALVLDRTSAGAWGVRTAAAGLLYVLAAHPPICERFSGYLNTVRPDMRDAKMAGLLAMLDPASGPPIPMAGHSLACVAAQGAARRTRQQGQEAALAALANVSLGSEAVKATIAHTAQIEHLVTHLAGGSFNAAANAAALIGNLAWGNAHNQAKLGKLGALKPLVAALMTSAVTDREDAPAAATRLVLQRNAATALRNLSECADNCPKLLKLGAVEVLALRLRAGGGVPTAAAGGADDMGGADAADDDLVQVRTSRTRSVAGMNLGLKLAADEGWYMRGDLTAPGEVSVQAVATLRTLAASGAAGQKALGDACGRGLLTRCVALLAHSPAESMREKAGGLLWHALKLETNRRLLLKPAEAAAGAEAAAPPPPPPLAEGRPHASDETAAPLGPAATVAALAKAALAERNRGGGGSANSGTARAAAQAAEALAELMKDAGAREVAGTAGVLEAFVELLIGAHDTDGGAGGAGGGAEDGGDGDSAAVEDRYAVRAAAANGLKNLTLDAGLQDQIAARAATALVEMCATADATDAESAVHGDAAASALRRAAASALWALASNNPSNQSFIAQKGAVEPLVAMCALLLTSTGDGSLPRDAEEQANGAGALWELAKDGENRAAIAACPGALLALVTLAAEGEKRVARTASQALKTLSASGAVADEIAELKAASGAATRKKTARPNLASMLKTGGSLRNLLGGGGGDAPATRAIDMNSLYGTTAAGADAGDGSLGATAGANPMGGGANPMARNGGLESPKAAAAEAPAAAASKGTRLKRMSSAMSKGFFRSVQKADSSRSLDGVGEDGEAEEAEAAAEEEAEPVAPAPAKPDLGAGAGAAASPPKPKPDLGASPAARGAKPDLGGKKPML